MIEVLGLEQELRRERFAHRETQGYLKRALRMATTYHQLAEELERRGTTPCIHTRVGDGGGDDGSDDGVDVSVMELAVATLAILSHATARLIGQTPPPYAEVRGQYGVAHDRLTRLLAAITDALPPQGEGEGG